MSKNIKMQHENRIRYVNPAWVAAYKARGWTFCHLWDDEKLEAKSWATVPILLKGIQTMGIFPTVEKGEGCYYIYRTFHNSADIRKITFASATQLANYLETWWCEELAAQLSWIEAQRDGDIQ